MWWITLGSWWAFSGCGTSEAPWTPPVVEIDNTPGLHLARTVPFVELEVPDDSHDGTPISEVVRLEGGWLKLKQTDRGGTLWSRPSPFRARGMFFLKAQKGMSLARENLFLIPYRQKPGGGGLSWNHDATKLVVHTRDAEAPPILIFRYGKAAERERRLHYRFAKEEGWVTDKASFVRGATVQEGWTSRQGLLLPAPGKAAWRITVPQQGQLHMSPGLVRPEYADLEPSDGCTLEVKIGEADAAETLFTKRYQPGEFSEERIDLSKWAGQEVRLSMETLPGPTTRSDFCFVGSPIVSKRKDKPRRVVLIFVDTLRPDHLSTFGYERETSPNLDRFAKGGAVFTQARSVAPWTLPSARTMITGFQPEHYDRVTSLPAKLGREGFATGSIAGNVYLSANFDMNRDWDHHEVDMFPGADTVTDRALAWLDTHQGQDSFLQVHYMSAHLPYKEPLGFRTRYAGVGPPGLQGAFLLQAVRRHQQKGLTDEDIQYIEDRYDNCVSWIDHELQRLYDQLNDEDIVIFTSDHGEEFWDHGGYEHGHTLYDELLRVPLVIRGPGIHAGRVHAPVSLLDIAPTIYDLLEIKSPSQGVSLVGASKGEPEALKALSERSLAVGRPLYGRERWGVITDQKKWTTFAGKEQVFDLRGDPHELTDLAATTDLELFRSTLGETLETRSGVSYRLLPNRNVSSARRLEVVVTVPGGIERAWFGADALQRSKGTVERIDEEQVKLTWHKGYRGTREAYVLPTKPVAEVTHQVGFRSRQGEGSWNVSPMTDRATASPEARRLPLHTLNVQDGAVKITWAMAPVVDEKWLVLDATDSENESWLEELGYLHREEPEDSPE